MNWHRIPNSLVLLLVFGFYGAALLLGWPPEKIIDHTSAGLVVLVALLALHFTLGLVGFGVIKLCSAIVLIFGFDSGLTFFAIAFASCGIVGVTLQVIKRRQMDMPFLPFAAFAAFVVVAANENWLSMIT